MLETRYGSPCQDKSSAIKITPNIIWVCWFKWSKHNGDRNCIYYTKRSFLTFKNKRSACYWILVRVKILQTKHFVTIQTCASEVLIFQYSKHKIHPSVIHFLSFLLLNIFSELMNVNNFQKVKFISNNLVELITWWVILYLGNNIIIDRSG